MGYGSRPKSQRDVYQNLTQEPPRSQAPAPARSCSSTMGYGENARWSLQRAGVVGTGKANDVRQLRSLLLPTRVRSMNSCNRSARAVYCS